MVVYWPHKWFAQNNNIIRIRYVLGSSSCHRVVSVPTWGLHGH